MALDSGFHGAEALADGYLQLAFSILALDGKFLCLDLRLIDAVCLLPAREDGDVKAEAREGIGCPLIFAELEVVGHGVQAVGESQRKSGQIAVFLHLYTLGKLLRLDVQLAQGGVPVQAIVPVELLRHPFGVNQQGVLHVDLFAEFDTHNSLELP